jgi:hypothetical protein
MGSSGHKRTPAIAPNGCLDIDFTRAHLQLAAIARGCSPGRGTELIAIQLRVLLPSSFAHLSLAFPPATTVQATVYSHFLPQPQGNDDQ